MKKALMIIGSIMLLLNSLLGTMLSSYSNFNCFLNSGIIVTTMILLLTVSLLKLKDGFKVSLCSLLPLACCGKLILGSLSPESFTDNFYIITIIVITFVELCILILSKIVSLIN